MNRKRNAIILGVCILLVIILGVVALFFISTNKDKNSVNKETNIGSYNVEGELYTLLKIDETDEENIYLNKENEVIKIKKGQNTIGDFIFGKAIVYADQYGLNRKERY